MYQITRAEVFGDGGFPVASNRYTVHRSTPSHSHDFLELAVVLDGTGRHWTHRGSSILRPGSVVLVRPGQWHGYSGCQNLEVFNLYLGPELTHRELSWMLDVPGLARLMLQGGQPAGRLGASARADVAGWLTQLHHRGTHPSPAGAIVSLGLVGCVLGEIQPLISAAQRAGVEIAPPVKKAIDLMSADVAHGWTMTELASAVNLSVSHLHHQFAAQVGTAPMRWLTGLRAERAAVLVMQTELSTTEIGRAVGWSDANYTSRRFRMAFGMGPQRYRSVFRGLQVATGSSAATASGALVRP